MTVSGEAATNGDDATAVAVQFDLEAVFAAHYGRVTRIIARVVGDPSRAEELAVEAFLKLWREPKAHGDGASGRRDFQPLRRYTVADSATWAQPAISGNRLFIKDVNTIALWTVG